MSRFFTLCIALVCLSVGVSAQNLRMTSTAGYGPFTNGTSAVNTFSITSDWGRNSTESVTFQIVCHDGENGALRVVRSGVGRFPTFSWQTNMSDLPFESQPAVIATVNFNHGGWRVTRQVSTTLDMRAPNINLTATNDWGEVAIGSAFTGRFGVKGCPPNTARIALYLQPSFGAPIDSVIRHGDNLDTATIRYSTPLHRTPLSLRAVLSFPGAPSDGYVLERAITQGDDLPDVHIKSSLGMGPFVSGRDAMTTFTIDSTFGAYASAIFTFGLRGRYDSFHQISSQLATWARDRDRFQTTVNMGEFPAYTSMRVEMLNAKDSVIGMQDVPISILRAPNPPMISMNRMPPLMFGVHGVDSIVIDSLPARTLQTKIEIISAAGKLVEDTTHRVGFTGFLHRSAIKFDGGTLPLNTHTVRVTVWSDYNPNPKEYEYHFDVRDTSKPYIYATNVGPFVQSDSATFSVGITDIHPSSIPVDRRYGWFQIVDTLTGKVLQRSDSIALDNVTRVDSLTWEDEQQGWILLQAASLPISAGLEFIEVGVRNDGSTFETTYTRPLLMIPRPGVLTASAGYGPFVAGQRVMNTFRIDSLPTDVKSVEFAIAGTENPSQVDSLIVTKIVNRTAQFTTNMGMLPINTRLRVTVRTEDGPQRGVTMERFIYVIPDTLHMQSRVGFDTIALGWNTIRVSGNESVTGPLGLKDSLTFRRLPAQTERITVATYDARDNRIDSISVNVPYRIRFDSNLVVHIPFEYRSLATSRIEVGIHTTGAPPEGITFGYPIVMRNPPMNLAVRRVDSLGGLDTEPVGQGSTDILDITTRPQLSNGRPGRFAFSNTIDSTRVRFLDCRGNIVGNLNLSSRFSANSNIVSTAFYSVESLPLTTTRAEITVYSRRLTFPDEGFVYTDTVRIVPCPSVSASRTGDFPTWVTDDTSARTLNIIYSIADLPLVDSVTLSVRDVRNNVVEQRTVAPIHDSAVFRINLNHERYDPALSPYTVTAAANYSVCSNQRSIGFDVGTFTVSRQFTGSPEETFVWSSAGWGPFQQGRSQFTQFIYGFNPRQVLTGILSHNTDIKFRTQIRAYTADRERIEWEYLDSTWVLPKFTPMPNRLRYTTPTSQIGGLNPGTWINIALTVEMESQTGPTPAWTNTWNYWFPIEMDTFPINRISSSGGWGPFEQSVSAGSSGTRTMQRPITITDTVYADIISRIPVVITDERGNRLDSMNMRAGASGGTGMDRYQIFTIPNYDVAQYPWPAISRDDRNVTLDLEYYFDGNNVKAGAQDERMSFIQRPEWLNGSAIQVTSVRDSVIFMTVTTPMPTTSWTSELPLIGRLPFRMGDANGRLNIIHRVQYNIRTGRFNFAPEDAFVPATFRWDPTFGDLGIARLNYETIARDGSRFDMFTALRRFESDWEGRPDRNLRLRAMIDAQFTFSPTTLLSVLQKVVEVIFKAKDIASPGPVSFAPIFAIHIGTHQLMNLNMGVEGGDQWNHLGSAPTIREATRLHANTYPTALTSAQIMDVNVGGELRFFSGWFGMGIALNNILRVNNGTIFQGPVHNTQTTVYPQGLTNRLFVVVDVSTFFGLLRLELFRGHLFSIHTPHGTPAFQIFPDRYPNLLQGRFNYGVPPLEDWKPSDGLQQETVTWAPLPIETPVYYSRPSIDANDSAVALVWTEHSLHSNTGAVVLGRVNPDSMSFKSEAIIADNDNGVHDPMVSLLGNDGTSLVLWNENAADAATTGQIEFDSVSIDRMLHNEDLHASIVNGKNQIIASWTLGDDLVSAAGRIDGKATVTVAKDGNSAVIAWPVQMLGDTTSDVAAVVLSKQGGEWKTGATTILPATSGFDELLDIMPVHANEFVLVSHTRQGMVSTTGSSSVNAWHYNGTWSAANTIFNIPADETLQSMAMDGNGDYGVLGVVTAKAVPDSASHELKLRTFEYTSEWLTPEPLRLNGMHGTLSDLDVSVDAEGKVTVFADVVYPHFDSNGVNDGERDSRISHMFTSKGVAEGWQSAINDDAIYEADERLWSMASATGPKGVMYVVGQELDTTYGNVQKYSNGIQVGPSRINTVLHAFRYNGDSIVNVPFKRSAVVDVHEDIIEKNLRYPCSLYDPYPNPTSGEGVIPFVVMQHTHVLIDVIDVTGKVMHTLIDTDLDAGVYDAQIPTATWPQGCYTLRMLTATGQLMSKTFTVIR